MKELNVFPGKKTPEVKEPKTKEISPSAPVVETPVPPQVMDPSAHPDIESKKSTTSPTKRKKHKKKLSKAR